MSYLDKLLDGVEFEWKALGEVTNILRGRRVTKSQLSDIEKFPVFHGGLEPLGYYEKCNRPANSVMIINVGASAGTVGFSDVDFWSSDGCYCIEHTDKFNNKFLYYALIGFQHHLRSKVRVAGIPTLDAIVVEKIFIPIPPLKVQEEIVRILDTFTELIAELIAELTAELTARKKQYTYYRDKLLSFEEGEVEWKALGDVCDIGDGLHGTPKYDDNGDYYFINGNNLDDGVIICSERTKKVNESMFKKYGIAFSTENTVFLSINGTIGSVALYNNEKIVLGKSVAFFNIKSLELNYKYLFFLLQTNFSINYFENQKTGSTIKNLGLKSLRSFKIPVPPLAEQERIVSILDKFDSLTSSITGCLPREIELRQKQYEYYRNMLLSFPKQEV